MNNASKTKPASYIAIKDHYEACFDEHGDNHKGVDWPEPEAAQQRYEIMLDVVKDKDAETSILDIGCGLGHLLEYMQENKVQNIRYSGLDISAKFVDACRTKFPDIPFYQLDLLEPGSKAEKDKLCQFDYVVMNGVFTEKLGLTQTQMLSFFNDLLTASFALCQKGLAFNVMSKHVDWEREDLFHLPFDEMAGIIIDKLSRHFVIRNDYGLYEYTVYIYR